MKNIITLEQKLKLFSILTNLGFQRTDMELRTIFHIGKEIIVFPTGELRDFHLMTTRKHLDANGRMESTKFNKIMNYE